MTFSLIEVSSIILTSNLLLHSSMKLLTSSSGASAPEILVEEFIKELKKEFTIEIEEVEIIKENITFKIPGKLN